MIGTPREASTGSLRAPWIGSWKGELPQSASLGDLFSPIDRTATNLYRFILTRKEMKW